MNIQKLKQRREEIDKQIKELEEPERLEQERNKDKPVYIKVPELGIEISQQIYNGKNYAEILKLVKEKQIATHKILFKLRGLTKKYPQFKDFWVFVPNPDKLSKDNGFGARLSADSGRTGLYCGWDPTGSDASLGVFLWRRIR